MPLSPNLGLTDPAFIEATKPSAAAPAAEFIVSAIEIVDAGSGYHAEDVLTVDGGTGTAATITVNSYTANSANVNPGETGSGYAVDDILYFADISASFALRVTGVGGSGEVTSVSVETQDTLSGYPASQAHGPTSTTGSGTGATFFLWGAIASASLTTGGSYTVKPTNPAGVTGGSGTSATFNLTW